MANSFDTLAAPCGTIFPNSPKCPRRALMALGSLPDQQLADAKDHCSALGLLALHRHEAHRRRCHLRFQTILRIV